MKKGPTPKSLAERFWAKVVRGDGCWGWSGQVDGGGYGRMRGPAIDGHRGNNVVASRISWMLHTGDIPPGLCVLHRCDNPPCVRPDHLFLGTLGDNNKDATSKGRNARGHKNGQSKLSDNDVIDIKSRISRGDVQRRIAEDYGVTFQLISEIARGNLWKDRPSKELTRNT